MANLIDHTRLKHPARLTSLAVEQRPTGADVGPGTAGVRG